MSITNKKANDEMILVIGGNGKTGRRVAERLTRAGRRIRIGSRRAEVPFDWENPATWKQALDGATAAYVTFQPDLAVPGALETIQRFYSQAIESGARKLVLLSGRGEEEAQQAEKALQATDTDWTILRASWFCQNFSESFFHEPITAGELALPVDSVVEPFIDAEDIAEVAVAALTEPEHSRKLYELTGPKALTFAEATDEIAKATGRSITFTPVSLAAYRAALERRRTTSVL